MDEATAVGTVPSATHSLDSRRVRSFVGLVLGRLGPRAHGAVSGTFLALLVGEHTRSLFWVTFALTAHRFVTPIAHPIAGRLSDRSDTRIGRRVPFMVAGLLIAGVCTALYINVDGYWPLVALMVLARLAFVSYSLPAHAATPETFGGSRWVRALVAITCGGLLVATSIRVTVLATWDQNDPSTWSAAYYLAAGYILFAALAIALLVREASAEHRPERVVEPTGWREAIRTAMQAPNAKVVLTGLLLAVAAGGAFDRIYPIYARDVLGAGGDDLAAAGIAEVVLVGVLFPLSWWLAGHVHRRALAVMTGLVWTAVALAHLWVNTLWQSVALIGVGTAFLIGTIISVAALVLRIIPRTGGLGQRVGLAIAPILIAEMIARFGSALAYDLVFKNYDVIWTITAALALPAGLVMLFLRLPPWAGRADLAYGGKVLRDILWGRRKSRSLFRGEIDPGDADGAALLEALQDGLDPYIRKPVA